MPASFGASRSSLVWASPIDVANRGSGNAQIRSFVTLSAHPKRPTETYIHTVSVPSSRHLHADQLALSSKKKPLGAPQRVTSPLPCLQDLLAPPGVTEGGACLHMQQISN